jgi:hypothetical protein
VGSDGERLCNEIRANNEISVNEAIQNERDTILNNAEKVIERAGLIVSEPRRSRVPIYSPQIITKRRTRPGFSQTMQKLVLNPR